MEHSIADPLLDISNKYARLDRDRRNAFRKKIQSSQPDTSVFPIVRLSDRTDRVPLSHAQERLWFLWRLEPDSPAYNIVGAVRLDGALTVGALREAVTGLVRRHESLRTRFEDVDGTAWQVIEPEPVFGWTEHDLAAIADDEAREATLREGLDRAAQTPFDLEKGPLLRIELFHLGEQEHVLHFAMHHIVSDGWSIDILVREFAAFYEAALDGGQPDLPELPIQYADYALWQREWLDDEALKGQLDYWRNRLGDEHPVLQLPVTGKPKGPRSNKGGRVTCEIPAEVADRLRKLSREHGATLFMTLLAAFDVLLYRYCNESDIRVGVPVAGRQRVETEGLIGFFVNTLVIRSDVRGDMTFAELLDQVRDRVLEAQANQDLPFDRLVAELQPDRKSNESPLTRVKFLLRDERPTESSIAELRCSALPLSDSEAHFDISLDVTETPTTIECRFSYDIEKFAPFVMEAFCENYQLLVQQLASERSTRIGGFDFKIPAEAIQPSPTAVSLLLARIARNCRELGSSIAIVEDDRSITWEALWKQSGDLASRLVDAGVSTEVPVAVQLPRSIELVVTLLAIWRTGGIYVPLDSSAPAERIVKQLGSAGIEVVISNEPLPGQTTSLAWITPEERGSGTIDDFETLPDQAAYIIFTSGSTGAPKGVTISHRALADYISSLALILPSEIRSAAYTSTPAADLGHTILFGALYYGWVLHLVPDRLIVDPDGFSEFMQANEIDLLKIVPSHLTGLLEASAPAGVLPSMCIVLGGEAAPKGLADRIVHLRPTCRLINHYGPTETTVGVLTRAGGETTEPILPIGRALAHVHVDVRDRDGNVIPYGADGEVCVSGSALARGYFRLPSATAERFVPAPFGPPGSRMYRTGDRGHLLDGGEIAFRGRFDDQVKIRGYRVEPGEIAHHLRKLPNVIDAAVIARTAEDGNAELHGYVVGKALDSGELRRSLSVVLPPQMIPSTIQVIDRIPVTLNGKVDRKKLPVPGNLPDVQSAAPTSEAEKILLDIWQEVLGRTDFGVLSDFFDLGGDSIRGLKIVARAKKAGLPVTPNSLFEKRTVRALAEGFLGEGTSRRKLEEMSALLDDLK